MILMKLKNGAVRATLWGSNLAVLAGGLAVFSAQAQSPIQSQLLAQTESLPAPPLSGEAGSIPVPQNLAPPPEAAPSNSTAGTAATEAPPAAATTSLPPPPTASDASTAQQAPPPPVPVDTQSASATSRTDNGTGTVASGGAKKSKRYPVKGFIYKGYKQIGGEFAFSVPVTRSSSAGSVELPSVKGGPGISQTSGVGVAARFPFKYFFIDHLALGVEVNLAYQRLVAGAAALDTSTVTDAGSSTKILAGPTFDFYFWGKDQLALFLGGAVSYGIQSLVPAQGAMQTTQLLNARGTLGLAVFLNPAVAFTPSLSYHHALGMYASERSHLGVFALDMGLNLYF